MTLIGILEENVQQAISPHSEIVSFEEAGEVLQRLRRG